MSKGAGSNRTGRSSRSAVVFGGAGFVGSHLCEALLADGTAVVCVDNLVTGSLDNIEHLHREARFRVVEHDITEPLPRSITRADPGQVFHLASAASPDDYHRLPLETLHAGAVGTERALELAREHRARFLLASTSEVYGDPLVSPQSESYHGNVNPTGPRSVYDEAKRYAEALTAAYRRTHGVDTAIARIFNTYGPRMRRDDGRMIPNFVCQALEGRSLTVTGSGLQTRSVCHVDDTVAGLLALVRSAHPGPVNIGNPDERTVLEIARAVAEVVGCDLTVAPCPPVEDDPQRRCPDITVARTALGWSPTVDLADGLTRTVRWFADTAPSSRPNPNTVFTGAAGG
ncbi:MULTISPECIES: GDP-mannose 4,6-dehydratase [unclassified Rhodococcus (in: high G+C Gram-positive bacteria)]|uniref:GDP-mannose 4,6-dehydratase n=1 Tax=unclassified Rhodococcus (in: high G+C Gram-positive bacteria) TaxID=192944 RepID=UPI001C9B5A10|nr:MULTISPECIES: GDP-mannose 4,6-dehydratase [unclassified Rhodococcus (in: high G+C Gram-positive bacteria)]MBY6680855.1 GDP-mannose 4,6-dehydratase [Rhodococcus sp. BP-316]